MSLVTLTIAELTERFPDFRVAVLVCEGLAIPASRPPALDALIAEREAGARTSYAGTDLSAIPGIAAWRAAYKGFGIKKTVIPGRLNEGWINVANEGYYFGQCSQICGNNHTYMPIAVRVVSKEEFDKWVEQKKKEAGVASSTDFASATAPANR